MQGNNLTTIPGELSGMQSLVQLSLADNAIATSARDSLAGMASLKTLWLYGNRLAHLPLALCHPGALPRGTTGGHVPSCPSLAYLWLEGNPSRQGPWGGSWRAPAVSGRQLSERPGVGGGGHVAAQPAQRVPWRQPGTAPPPLRAPRQDPGTRTGHETAWLLQGTVLYSAVQYSIVLCLPFLSVTSCSPGLVALGSAPGVPDTPVTPFPLPLCSLCLQLQPWHAWGDGESLGRTPWWWPWERPGVPNWGGLLKKMTSSLPSTSNSTHNGSYHNSTNSNSTGGNSTPFDTLYVVDPSRSWYTRGHPGTTTRPKTSTSRAPITLTNTNTTSSSRSSSSSIRMSTNRTTTL